MHRLIALSAALLCLSACASPTQLRSSAADIDTTTNKPAERVAGCIGDAFEKFNVGLVSMSNTTFSTRPTANGYSISGTQPGPDTVILIDIAKADSGSHVTMFDHFIVKGGGKWADLVRGCL